MRERINEKVFEIEKYLEELSQILPGDFVIYKKDLKIKAACERYLEKIVEAVIDLVFMIMRDKNLKIPEEEGSAFDMLYNENIISKDLSEKLKNAKGMRNFIIHQYEKIDDEFVFETITEELKKDVQEFLEIIGGLDED